MIGRNYTLLRYKPARYNDKKLEADENVRDMKNVFIRNNIFFAGDIGDKSTWFLTFIKNEKSDEFTSRSYERSKEAWTAWSDKSLCCKGRKADRMKCFTSTSDVLLYRDWKFETFNNETSLGGRKTFSQIYEKRTGDYQWPDRWLKASKKVRMWYEKTSRDSGERLREPENESHVAEEEEKAFTSCW